MLEFPSQSTTEAQRNTPISPTLLPGQGVYPSAVPGGFLSLFPQWALIFLRLYTPGLRCVCGQRSTKSPGQGCPLDLDFLIIQGTPSWFFYFASNWHHWLPVLIVWATLFAVYCMGLFLPGSWGLFGPLSRMFFALFWGQGLCPIFPWVSVVNPLWPIVVGA